MKKRLSEQVKVVLTILDKEVRGDVVGALKLLDKNYTMTWVYEGYDKKLFPRTKKNIKRELDEVYPIKGRKYDIKHVAEGDKVVMIELVESYPDPKTKKIYRTPLVIILEMKGSKIKRGRHYCDPRLSYKYLTQKQINKIFS
jgi:ketosteroid isomerase-like protein